MMVHKTRTRYASVTARFFDILEMVNELLRSFVPRFHQAPSLLLKT